MHQPYIPVVDLDIEHAVLGRMLTSVNDALICADQLRPEDFFEQTEQELFSLIASQCVEGARDLGAVVEQLSKGPYLRSGDTILDPWGALVDMINLGMRHAGVKKLCFYVTQMAHLRELCPEVAGKSAPYATQYVTLAAYAIDRKARFLGVYWWAQSPMYVFRCPAGVSIDDLVAEYLGAGQVSLGTFGTSVEAILQVEPPVNGGLSRGANQAN